MDLEFKNKKDSVLHRYGKCHVCYKDGYFLKSLLNKGAAICKRCKYDKKNAYRKEWYKTEKGQASKGKFYRDSDRLTVLIFKQFHRLANPEMYTDTRRKYEKLNPETVKRAKDRWAAENRERRNGIKREWFQKMMVIDPDFKKKEHSKYIYGEMWEAHRELLKLEKELRND